VKEGWKRKIWSKDPSIPDQYEEPIAKRSCKLWSYQGIPPEPNKGLMKECLFLFDRYVAQLSNTSEYVLSVYDKAPTSIASNCSSKGNSIPELKDRGVSIMK